MENIFTLKNIVAYVIVINLITFICMGIDKYKAKNGKWRIKEKTLITLAVLGGGIGEIIGMYYFRHKTKKPKFYIGVPIILIIEIILIIMYVIKS